ncbi:MAG TPA: hypothetical protein VHV83_02505 [Armatimonadota bacterium]|nr:hypothetical protein [Armatimonadota bacterium]
MRYVIVLMIVLMGVCTLVNAATRQNAGGENHLNGDEPLSTRNGQSFNAEARRNFKPQTRLYGGELLCEMNVVSECSSLPGIYAIDTSLKKISCVIPYGKKPIWSPDHKRLVYWYNAVPYLYETATGDSYPIARKYLIGAPVTSDICWTPDSKNVVYLMVCPPFPSILPHSASLVNPNAEPDPIWDRAAVEQVGAISFSSDGNYAAYVSATYYSNRLKLPRDICVANLKDNTYKTISNTIVGDRYCYNPQWQPNGPLIAFETYSNNNKKNDVFLYNTSNGSLKSLSLIGRPYSNGGVLKEKEAYSKRLLNWSPDGKCLLIVPEHKDATVLPAESAYLNIVPLDETKPLETICNSSGLFFDASWSSDGSQIAYLYNPWSIEPSYNRVELYFWKKGEGLDVMRLPEALVPVDVEW